MKSRTTINIDDELVEAVRASGVSNFSGYLERLIKNDLAALEDMGKREAKKIVKLRESLSAVRDEWKSYLKKQRSSVE